MCTWGLVLGTGLTVGEVLALVGAPSPVLFGALFAGMALALGTENPPEIPAPLFRLGQALIGVTIGALVQLPTLTRLVRDWPSVLGVTLGTLAISLSAGRLLAVRKDVSTTTGVFALIAGGASGVVAISRELGADDRVVTVVQYLRVLTVLLAMPVLAALIFHPRSGVGTLETVQTRWGPDLVFVVVSVAIGVLITWLLRAPVVNLLGPMVVAVAISASGVFGPVTVPPPVQNLGYALIGVAVGLRFTRESVRSIARLVPVVVALIALVIAGCAALGVALAAATGVDELTAYLATTPGGLFAVLALAADSGSDTTYVLAVQVIRLFTMLLAAPLVARVLARERVGSTER